MDHPIELPKAVVVRRSFVVLVVGAELGIQGVLLLVHRIVSALFAPFGDGLQPPTESREIPLPAACAKVR